MTIRTSHAALQATQLPLLERKVPHVKRTNTPDGGIAPVLATHAPSEIEDTGDPRLAIGTNTCQCTECGEYFNSVYAFDEHQYGDLDDIKCMTTREMVAKKWGRNRRGVWVTRLWEPEAAEIRYGGR